MTSHDPFSDRLSEIQWQLLLMRIRDGECTPFLGAGAAHGALPLGADVAHDWAKKYGYPLEDQGDLARVAQYLAVSGDAMFPKDSIIRLLREHKPPDFTEPDEPHAVLADLPLPVYMTTNYDDFMVRALQSRNKVPRRELCRWHDRIANYPSAFDRHDGYEPTNDCPVVFHLHGHDKVGESLVLTEDDYLDFLVAVSEDRELLPPSIQSAMTSTSLLFVGYALSDWSFRVLFRGLITKVPPNLRRISVTVQLPRPSPNLPVASQLAMQKYLDKYFEKIEMRVYWGTAREFMAELGARWRQFNNGQ